MKFAYKQENRNLFTQKFTFVNEIEKEMCGVHT